MENQKQNLNVPLGYKFIPKPSELLIHYLLNKILGLNPPADVIPTFDCFSHSPDQLPFEQFKYGRQNEWYFYTTKRQETIVTLKDGYYKVSGEREEYEGHQVIGSIRIFEYYYGKPPSRDKSEWSIIEFSVDPQLVSEKQTSSTMDTNLVVCKVIKETTTISTLENATFKDVNKS